MKKTKRRKDTASKLKSFNKRLNMARKHFANRKNPTGGRKRQGDLAPIQTLISPEAWIRKEEMEAEALRQHEEIAKLEMDKSIEEMDATTEIILAGWDDKEREDVISSGKGEDSPCSEEAS